MNSTPLFSLRSLSVIPLALAFACAHAPPKPAPAPPPPAPVAEPAPPPAPAAEPVVAAPAPAPDPTPDQVWNLLQEKRRALGKPAFNKNPQMDGVVTTFAQQVCAKSLPPSDFKALTKAIHGAGIRYSNVQAERAIAKEILPATFDSGFEKVLGSNATHLSVALCRGDFPNYPDGLYVIAVSGQQSMRR